MRKVIAFLSSTARPGSRDTAKMGGNTSSKQGAIQRQKKSPVPSLAGPFAELKPFLLDDVSKEMAELGNGSYAVVKTISRRGETFAAKQLHASLFGFASPEEKDTMLAQFARECKLLHRAAHPNIVKFIGLHIDEALPLPYLVMEFMQTTLSCHVDKNGKPNTPTAFQILSDVALGLQFLHKHIPSIIHRDLSANNVLLSSTLKAKISDLGMAKIIDQRGQKLKLTQTKAPGTPCYMPPEALQDRPTYDTSIDTFSFGVLMIHVLSGQWPLPVHGNKVNPANRNELIALTEFQCRIKYAEEAGLDHPLMPLIERCLHNNPLSRPSASDIAETVMAVMAEETKPRVHVATGNYMPKKSYELNAQVGESFFVYGDTLTEGSLLKVASKSSRQVGFIPKETIHKLDDLYIATEAYFARSKDEVSVASKEFLLILNNQGSRVYVEAISSGRRGLVPSKYIIKFKPMDKSDWFVPGLSSDEVNALLAKPLNGEGVFLVRDDDDEDGHNKVLHVKHNDSVFEYKILATASGSYSLENKEVVEEVFYQRIFNSVEEVILYYSGKKEDICTRLEKPCVYTSDWEIKADEIELVTRVASSGQVEEWKGFCGKIPIQGKKFKSIAQPREVEIEEVEVMKRLNQQNIVKFHGIAVETMSITIITEYLDWKTLVQYYIERDISSLPVNVAISLLRQVVNGLTHLQDNSTVHLRFGARSVLFNKEPSLQCKITNFNLAKRIEVSNKLSQDEELEMKWLPPEVFEGGFLHKNCDVWSFGIFIHELFTACNSPYNELNDSEVATQVKSGYQMVRPNACPEPIHAIAKECWNLDPEKRPSFKSLQPRMRQLTVALTMDGRPIPAPRTNLRKNEKPVPKPRKRIETNYINTNILPSPENAKNQAGVGSESAQPVSEVPKGKSVVPLLPSIPPPPPKKSQNREYHIKRKELNLVSKIKTHLKDEVWDGVWKGNTPVLVTLQQAEVPEQIEIIKKFKNDNVHKLLGFCTLETPIYLISEAMKPGSLRTFLRGNNGALEDEVLLQMGIDIAKGMAYLHSHFLIHRDLRADTILLDENNTCKIAHFNFVKSVDEDTHTYTAMGSEMLAVRWAAPEAMLNGVYSTRSDVWSFGIILYEIVTYGTMPYPGMKNADAIKRVSEGYRMPQPDSTYCPEEVYGIMLRCWDQKPDSRPSSIILPQTLRDLMQQKYAEEIYSDDEFEGYINIFSSEISMTDWNIECSDLTFASELARGSLGSIWQGQLKKETSVAIKCINVHPIEGETKQRVEIMKHLENPNILQLHGICTTTTSTYIITELMQHGNLREYLNMNSNSLKTTDLVSFSCQISNGMTYLEEKEIIHDNLSAVKVLVGERETGKIVCKIHGMFGTEDDKATVGFKIQIPPKWMAPETAVEKIYQQESDIWAFGVVLYEIMTFGQEPFPGMTDDEVLDQVIRGYRMPYPAFCREDMYSLMLECWNEDPSRRPTFEAIATKLSDIETYEDFTNDEIERSKAYADFPLEQSDDSVEETIEVNVQLKIAESASGDIWRGTWKGVEVAIKYPKAIIGKETLQSFELMKRLTNPNILQILGFFSKNLTQFVVMEFMCRGNLQDYIAWEGSFLTLEKQIEIARQCAKGMSYLESRNIIHGNLTARKVLVGDNLECKITGILGESIESEDPYSGHMTFYVPYKWMAVETVVYDEFSMKSDTWCFGILLYEIMTHGDDPYPQWSSLEVVAKVQEGYRMPCPPDCPKEAHTVMMECWNENPSQRPSFPAIERKLEDIIAYDCMPVQEEWPWDIRACDLSQRSKVADLDNGEVWSGVFRGKTQVAILCPTRHSLSAEIVVAENMKSLKHPQILSIFGVCAVSANTMWICTEMMSNGQLKSFVQREKKTLSVQKLVQFSAQCASGMLYLDERGIIHGNLTAQQILVGEDFNCKITGISGGGVAHEDPYEGGITYFLPVKWRAPETIKYNDFTMTTDVWSFGIVLYEIMSYGRDPYSGMSNSTASEEIQKGHHMEVPPNSPRQFGSLLLDCWAKVPDMRPKFDNITLRLSNLLKFVCECESDQSAAAQESWVVKQTDVVFEEKLTSGKSGDIWKGVLKETKPVAIQVMVEKDEEWIRAMVKLKHSNVLDIEAVCYTPEEVFVITELMENDNLVKFLRGGGRSLKLQQLIHIAVQVSDGMAYLKKQQVVHRDLCARNVLVGEKMVCKISGILGDWADVVDDPYYEERVYTPPVKWAAPEAALYGTFTYQSDLWSFGILLYEIMTYGRFPYPGMTRHEVISKIEMGYRMPCPTNCPSPLYDIMRKCWHEEPAARYSPEDLNSILHKYHEDLSSAENEWEVEEVDVIAEERIGQSMTGEEFWRGKFHHKPAVIKYHSAKQPLREFIHETEVLQTISHANVIAFQGLCPKGRAIFMVIEPVKMFSLLRYLQTLKIPPSHGKVLEMAFDVASGMAYLHKQGVIHRNLSAANIMVGIDDKCRVANFQQAMVRKQGVSLSGKKAAGNVRWMAVEVLSNNQYSMMSDVWSYGIFLYELAAQGQTPYPDLTDGLVYHQVPNGYRMPAPPCCPRGLYEVMSNCWKENPRHRPTFDHIHSSIESLLTQDQRWETTDDQVVKKQILGKEKHGELWKSEWKNTQAVVKYHKPGSCSPEVFLWEAEIIKTLEHHNVVKLQAVCTQAEKHFIVFEGMDEILFTVLRQTDPALKLSEILSMAAQVAKGMAYIQDQKIIHRSLMARSVLVKEKQTCKVSNFNEAIIEGRELTQAQKDSLLPLRWTSPESVYSKSFSTKSDMWSFGVLLHEAFTCDNRPYNDIQEPREIVEKLNEGYRMPRPETCPQRVYTLILECWSEDPQKRPTFKTIIDELDKIQDDLDWEIDPSEVTLVKEIDSGRFGEVWEGKYKETSVAVKYHKPNTNVSQEFLWEAELLKTLKHPHVVELIGLNSSAEKIFMIMTYLKSGTLLLYLKSFGRSQTLKTLMTMGAQVADGMAYLQTQGIIHRDLAARSVLVGENNICMISDFSEAICTSRSDNPTHKDRQFPRKWLPPEAVVDNVFNMHTDIWSYSILLYEIITFGEVPYKGISLTEALRMVREGYRMPMPHGCPEDAYDIMSQCWRDNPSSRPTFETVHLQMQRICQTCKNAPIVRSRTLAAGDVKVERRRSWTTVGSDVWEIDRSQVTLDSKHEEGRFGEVWKGQMKGSETVAIKTPKPDRTTASEFLHEAEIMKMIKHPNIVSLRGVCTKGNPILIITEFMVHGSLVKYLRSLSGRRTALPQLLTWAIQVGSGMVHLEQNRIVHRDVAARNVLVGQELVCKISDFGLAQKVSGDTYKESSRTQFPLKWMAPETLHQRMFSVKSDVWAFGILLYEMVTHGALPYPGVLNKDIVQLIKAGYRMPCPRGCSKALYEIMDSCWKEKPEERPNFSTIHTALNSLQRNKQ